MTAPVPLSDRLQQLEEALAAATPGEWRYDPREPRTVRDSHPRLPAALITFRDPGADAALIVAAVNLAPELIAKVRELDARIRAGLALADELTSTAKSTRTSSLPHTRPGATERARPYDDLAAQVRTALTAPLAGQHTTDDTREKD